MPEYIIGIAQPSPIPASFFDNYLAESVEYETHQVLEINAQDVLFDPNKNSLLVKLFGSIGETPKITFAAQKILYVEDEEGILTFLNPRFCETCYENSGVPAVKEVPFAHSVLGLNFHKMRCGKCGALWTYIVQLP